MRTLNLDEHEYILIRAALLKAWHGVRDKQLDRNLVRDYGALINRLALQDEAIKRGERDDE